MANDDTLVSFKTGAWKSTGMAAGYAQRMRENRGTNRLKNHVEIALCRENICGRRIVDVGIGTGRGSLPLAHDGLHVTGIDVSQAMLDQCRQEAGGAAIDLRAGDLTKLPAADEEFDSLIALNVAVHFPNWAVALKDWARVVKSGGRLVFDVHSRDHLNAVGALHGCAGDDLLTPQQRTDPAQFMLRVTAREIAREAENNGLCVVALIPYAAVLGGGNVNYWLLGSRLFGYLGDRALSWMANDERLFAFGAFIERTLAARLSTHATGRFMVVLEKSRNDGATQTVLAHQDRMASLFAGVPRLHGLRKASGETVDGWPAELQLHLAYERNRTLLAMALTSPFAVRLRPLIRDLAGEELTRELYDANERQAVDDGVYEAVRSWRRPAPGALHFKGIDLGPVFEYDLMREMLDARYFSKAQRS
ncbi:MAG: class I SAM-dependent methyltransferase [Candidatus Baltobacteraceae bacterium]